MMPAARLGDMNTGEPGFPPTASLAASVDVTANDIGIVRQGDSYGVHNCGTVVHPITALRGSSTVFINNLPAIRQGDLMSCSPINFAHIGSPDVTIG